MTCSHPPLSIMVAYGISYLPAHVEDDDRVLLEKGEKEQ